MAEEGYLLDNQVPAAGTRFEAIARLFDAVSHRHLSATGLAPGWRVWEVGAGGANLPAWLAERVGPTGHVLATDLDVSWARGAAGPNVEVRRHDVAVDPIAEGAFDLVHARLVLVHVPAREAALAAMVRALKPGGWLVLEDADPALQPLACPDESGPDQALANRVRAAFRRLLAARGADLAFGRKLPRLLRAAGLEAVTADAYFPVTHPAGAVLERATIAHIREGLLADGAVTAAELDQLVGRLDTLDLATAPLISAAGRKPRAPGRGDGGGAGVRG
jgi:SAM-dependent methyltransferase